MKKKSASPETSITRSSAVEYLTFIAAKGEGGVEVAYADEDIWLTQRMMGVLYDVKTNTINYHLKGIFADNELEEDSVIRKFRITAADGKNYHTGHYNLSAHRRRIQGQLGKGSPISKVGHHHRQRIHRQRLRHG